MPGVSLELGTIDYTALLQRNLTSVVADQVLGGWKQAVGRSEKGGLPRGAHTLSHELCLGFRRWPPAAHSCSHTYFPDTSLYLCATVSEAQAAVGENGNGSTACLEERRRRPLTGARLKSMGCITGRSNGPDHRHPLVEAFHKQPGAGKASRGMMRSE